MTRVYTTHGVVERCDPARFVHRNMHDVLLFQAYLRERRTFVSLEAALRGEGDALTIDDATSAGAEAARAARALGHPVTFFVNPWYIEERRPYFFTLLHPLLDAAPDTLTLKGESFAFRTPQEKKVFRKRLKALVVVGTTADAQETVVQEFAQENNLSAAPPEHLETISLATLRELQDAGVAIENHGWMHLYHDACTEREYTANITRGAEWLTDTLGVVSRHYALPFGDARELPGDAARMWYLLYDRQKEGWITDRVFNRTTLSIPH